VLLKKIKNIYIFCSKVVEVINMANNDVLDPKKINKKFINETLGLLKIINLSFHSLNKNKLKIF